jgi:hypothetical protein
MVQPLLEGSKNRFRDWFRKVWDVRGGGLYALGFIAAFLYFEVVDLFDDVMGIGAVFNGQAVEFIMDFFLDSLMNTLQALIWPVDVVRWAPPWGAIALGLGYWLFPIYVKPYIEDWLFDGEQEQGEEPESSS